MIYAIKNGTEIGVSDTQERLKRALTMAGIDLTGVTYSDVKPVIEPSLAEVKANKIAEFKRNRDAEEVESIEYNGNTFDYDDKARERLSIARQVLEDSNGSIPSILWSTADNNKVELTVNDFKAINSLSALRSNNLHIKYNSLKEEINNCNSIEEVNNINW